MTVKLIIDTDPGVDDVLGILLALRSRNVEIPLISLCFGNCDTVNSLRNILSVFYVLDAENAFRKTLGDNEPYTTQRPIVSVGLTEALDGTEEDAADIHGSDGLGNVHTLAPEFTAPAEWIRMFDSDESVEGELGFVPSRKPAYLEILRVLADNEPGTVVICATGPLMNLARAAELDPATFARVKSIVSMGGALTEPGNVTPLAEFNVFSDPIAAARVYSLTASRPETTLPPGSPQALLEFAQHTKNRRIPLILVPLDITLQHLLSESTFQEKVKPLLAVKSPLAQWMNVWMKTSFDIMRAIQGPGVPIDVQLHDPLAMWYAITEETLEWTLERDLDIRVETKGEWTRGGLVIDRRGRARRTTQTSHDRGDWLWESAGNRVHVCVRSPAGNGPGFGRELINVIFS